MLKLAIMSTLSIDQFGRVLIPKKVRDELSLKVGQALELEVIEGKVVLVPSTISDIRLVEGFPVFDTSGQEDIGDAITFSRNQRESKLLE